MLNVLRNIHIYIYIYIYIYTNHVQTQQSYRAALLKSDSNEGHPPQVHHTNASKHSPTRAPPKECIRVNSKIKYNLK